MSKNINHIIYETIQFVYMKIVFNRVLMQKARVEKIKLFLSHQQM